MAAYDDPFPLRYPARPAPRSRAAVARRPASFKWTFQKAVAALGLTALFASAVYHNTMTIPLQGLPDILDFSPPAQVLPIVKLPPIQASTDKALRAATEGSRIDYDLAARLAFSESSFRADAFNDASNACGLMQITRDGTLPYLLAIHGKEHGYDKLRRPIDRACRDPFMSAQLGVDYAEDNAAYLESKGFKNLNYTDIRFAHFLGPEGARRFLKAYRNPLTRHRSAEHYVSAKAIADNPFDFKENGTGPVLSVDEIYERAAAVMTKTPIRPAP